VTSIVPSGAEPVSHRENDAKNTYLASMAFAYHKAKLYPHAHFDLCEIQKNDFGVLEDCKDFSE
jgi:hypothetical protein